MDGAQKNYRVPFKYGPFEPISSSEWKTQTSGRVSGSAAAPKRSNFALVLLPMLAKLLVLLDTAWAIFAKTTLQGAVRVGVRVGITLTAPQMARGACLTDTVKTTVQQNSMGLLAGNSGLKLIKVNYYLPPAADSNGAVTDVSTLADGNKSGNIMQVSVQDATGLANAFNTVASEILRLAR